MERIAASRGVAIRVVAGLLLAEWACLLGLPRVGDRAQRVRRAASVRSPPPSISRGHVTQPTVLGLIGNVLVTGEASPVLPASRLVPFPSKVRGPHRTGSRTRGRIRREPHLAASVEADARA